MKFYQAETEFVVFLASQPYPAFPDFTCCALLTPNWNFAWGTKSFPQTHAKPLFMRLPCPAPGTTVYNPLISWWIFGFTLSSVDVD